MLETLVMFLVFILAGKVYPHEFPTRLSTYSSIVLVTNLRRMGEKCPPILLRFVSQHDTLLHQPGQLIPAVYKW